MELDSNLLKEFAKMTNDSEVKTETKYLRGTIVKNSGGKFVQLDGSTTATPISEIVDVQEGDRVLVTIENHKATIVGNFTFAPSARKEQEAINKADAAQGTANQAGETANAAQIKAREASDKADEASNKSVLASTAADEAKQQATEALNKANSAQANVQEAKDLATQASTDATEAKNQAAQSQASSAEAQAKVTELQNEVNEAKGNIDDALAELESQADEIAGIKETYSTKVETENAKAEMSTEITKKVGELETKVAKDYSTKTENVELEGRLQTQITQNSEGLTSQATKIEKLEGNTADAQKDVENALAQAAAAQSTAAEAQTKAQAAQEAANAATADANSATQKAQLAQNAADAATAAANAADKAVQEAQGDLNEAKQNLATVTSRVDATEAEIAEAQQKVDAAQESVNEALADAAEARLAANNATEAAQKAQQDAETAQGTATAAQQKADNAKTAADNAQSAANKAQEDVAALTKRVTTAETNIKQNSEKIELNASKTEEIGDALKNDYYKKTETDAKFEVTSQAITSTVEKVETIEKDFNNLEVGARNLLLGTRTFNELRYADSTLIDETYLDFNIRHLDKLTDEPTVHGEFANFNAITPDPGGEYIFSFYAKGSGQLKCFFYEGSYRVIDIYSSQDVRSNNGDGCILIELTDEWKRYWIKYTLEDENTLETTGDKSLLLRVHGGDEAYVCGAKFEKGNMPTDWSPAPEDAETKIDDAQTKAGNAETIANNAQAEVTIAQSTIVQLSNMIANLVTDGNGTSLMTQTPDGWTFNMSSIQNNLSALANEMDAVENGQKDTNDALTKLEDLVNSVEAKTAYITLGKDDDGNPCIELGKTDNEFKVRITNTAIDFLEGSTKIAYVNNKTFYTEKMIVKNELQIGAGPGFVWRTRSNGNMGLVYISG